MTSMKKAAFGIALALVYSIIVSRSGYADGARPDLTGLVKAKQGEPVPNAMVIIAAAGPRQGNSPLCPGLYPDCDKRAVTDASGKFRIESLDPDFSFAVRVVAPGYWPFLKTDILPENGSVEMSIDPRDLSKIPPERHARGRIMYPDGNPVARATLDVNGEEEGSVTHWGGISVDGMVITDANGEFHIVGPKPFIAVHAVVEAPGLAKRWVRLEPGKTALVRMTNGATVSGRLLFKGKPLADIRLGASTVNRTCGIDLMGFRATTGNDGRFTFENIPPNTKFQIFSMMDSAKTAGGALRLEFDSVRDNGTVDLGTIQAQPVHRVSGRVTLADGKPVPPQTRLLFCSSNTWDFALVTLDKEGRFEVGGVPEEQVRLTLGLNGYRFSEKNPSLDSNRRGLIGRVTGDIANLTILLEPGNPVPYEELERLSYEDRKKRNEMPLKSVQ
ncbi:MAG: carboxypeptidase regulatory-like domain-containing protein [Chthoniobacteraceae bacterium]